MSTLALSRNPSSTATRHEAGAELGRNFWGRLRGYLKARRDRRLLQTFSPALLADIGLEKLEFRSAADGRRDVWIIPHRYH